MRQSLVGRVRARLFEAASGPVHFCLEQAIRDPATRSWLLHTLGNDLALTELGLESARPRELKEIRGFEDCWWLYSSNPLNHGMSRLRIDEAAWLFRFVRDATAPRVVEIGRLKGGTTLLIAVAGGHVTTLDNGRFPGQGHFDWELDAVLRRFGLADQVDIIVADALTYPLHHLSADLVILDTGLDDFEGSERFFEHWWPAVAPGGSCLFRDGKETVLKETERFVDSLSADQIGGEIDRELPGAFVMVKKAAEPEMGYGAAQATRGNLQ